MFIPYFELTYSYIFYFLEQTLSTVSSFCFNLRQWCCFSFNLDYFRSCMWRLFHQGYFYFVRYKVRSAPQLREWKAAPTKKRTVSFTSVEKTNKRRTWQVTAVTWLKSCRQNVQPRYVWVMLCWRPSSSLFFCAEMRKKSSPRITSLFTLVSWHHHNINNTIHDVSRALNLILSENR